MKIKDFIYSKKEKDYYTIRTIFGIKFRILQKRRMIKDSLDRALLAEKYFFDIFHKDLLTKANNSKNPLGTINEKLKGITHTPKYFWTTSDQNYLNLLFNVEPIKFEDKFEIDDTYIIWGIRPNIQHLKTLNYALELNKNVLFIEDSFLRSADTFVNAKAPEKYRKGISFTVDDLTCYFDATKVSRLEQMLNDKNLVVTEEQKLRAKKCIDKIIKNHLTKYNHQPIYEPKIGREGTEKILVIDQTYGDMSILKGLADENTFKIMLETAIRENPDADIIVKTHPDTMTGKKSGYYTDLKEQGNIYLQKAPVNPISLINYVDKVYVCSTQFGFEALMAGKEVHTFGMPFYANWGLTIDYQKLDRRNNTRSLEEIFYIAYILYSHYVSPKTGKVCEIEEAMDYLLELREEYWSDIKCKK